MKLLCKKKIIKRGVLFFLYSICITLTYSQVGINTMDPAAYLHIVTSSQEDPLRIRGIKSITDVSNDLDKNSSYEYLKISDNGVIRKNNTKTKRITKLSLKENITIATGEAEGTGGSFLSWIFTESLLQNEITLPEDGSYLFTFYLYGTASLHKKDGTQTWHHNVFSQTYYIFLYKNSSMFDASELNIIVSRRQGKNNQYTSDNLVIYNAYLSCTGKAGDKIQIKMANYPNISNFNWILSKKTTMSFFKL